MKHGWRFWRRWEAQDGTKRRGSRRLLAILGAFYIALAAANPMSSTVHGDGYYTYLWARTLVFDGDIDFANDYRLCPDPWGLANSPVGENVNYWNLGPALFWAPILAWDRITHPLSHNGGPDGIACTGPMPERAVYGSLLAGLWTVLLGYWVARRRFGESAAFWGALAGGLLTPLTYYATTMLSYGHAASSFGAAVLIYAWDTHRQKSTTKGWAAMGAALGLAMLMRSQNAIMVALPLGTWLVWASRYGSEGRWRDLGKHVLRGLLFSAMMIAVFAPQFYYWWTLTGSPFAISQGEHYMRWGAPRIMSALFASSSGLFPWNPILYLAVGGWIAMVRGTHRRALGVAFVVLFAADAYVVGSVYDWWGSVGFPGRRYDMLAAPFIVGLAALAAALLRQDRRRRTAVIWLGAMLLGASFFWSAAVYRGVARGMRTDTAQTAETKWQDTYAQVSESVWKAVGNPLSWPASLPFALRYRQHPRDWDVVGSQELFYHDHQTLQRRELEATLRANDEELDGYFGGTFSSEVNVLRGQSVRFAHQGGARVLLPLHWPDLGAVEVRVMPVVNGRRPKVSMTLNGVYCGTQRLTRDTAANLRFDVPPGASQHRINEAWLWIEDGSIAITQLRLLDPNPPPSVAQAQRNAELRAQREAVRRAMLEAASDGAAEDGAAEDGAAEDGAAEDAAAEDGAADDGSAEDGAAEDGSAEDGSAEDGSAEDGSAEDGAAEDGAAEDGAAEDGAADALGTVVL